MSIPDRRIEEAVDLYLVRHGIAEPRDPVRWPDDALRPLSDSGVGLLRTAACGLRRMGVEVETVLSSSYVRAWQTAEILAQEAGWPPPEASVALEPPSPPSACIDVLGARQDSSLVLVGHQPQLSEIAALLLTGSEAPRLELKKGGVIWLRFQGSPAVGSGLLRGSVSPKILRQLGR